MWQACCTTSAAWCWQPASRKRYKEAVERQQVDDILMVEADQEFSLACSILQ